MSKHKREAQNHQTTADDPTGAAEPSTAGRASPNQATTQPSPPSETAVDREEHAEASERLGEQLKQAHAELTEFKDKYLRVLAESENSRKRLRQQGEEAVAREREKMLRELLPIVDNLERAVEAARGGGNGEPIVEGVEMVLRAMLDFLKSHGVSQLSSIGKPFDPGFHEAVDQVESAEHAPNTIIREFHPAYQIGDRLLRPARVTVSKPAGKPETKANHEGSGGLKRNSDENGPANGGPKVETN